MNMLSQEQFERCKHFIYRHGRLLDRKRFAFHFEKMSKEKVLQVLEGYQNDDGGFGHGIELDVMCPVSTAIGTEVAMSLLDELDVTTGPIVDRLESWILSSQQENGAMPPMPLEIMDYPHGEWWEGNKDEERVLSLAAYLGKWGRGSSEFFKRASTFFDSLEYSLPQLGIYGYQIYLYIRYAPNVPDREQRLNIIHESIPALLEEPDNYTMFYTYWQYAVDEVSRETLEALVRQWVAGLQDDGGLKFAYPHLPWWRPVVTLDGLIGLKKHGLLSFDAVS